MASKTSTVVYDDIYMTTGDEVVADQTVDFAFDGRSYQIDLTDEHEKLLREALQVYIDAARPVGRAPAAKRGKASTGKRTDREQSQRIRGWARQQGGEMAQVSDRGRIPAYVIDAYYVSHPEESQLA